MASRSVAGWIEAELRIPEGRRIGEPVKLLPFQKRFIRAVERHPISALTMGRGNGKSTLTAMLALAAFVGPWARPRGQVLIVAGAGYSQARLVFAHCRQLLKPMLESDPNRWRISENDQRCRIEDRHTGAILESKSANARALLGASILYALFDEPAAARVSDAQAILNALIGGQGKQEDSRVIVTGTRAADPAHPFSRMLDGGQEGVHVQAHTGKSDLTWGNVKAANPLLPSAPDLAEALKRELKRAKSDEIEARSFQCYRLNAGISEGAESPLVSAAAWKGCAGELDRTGAAIWGIDLGLTTSWSAVACVWPESGSVDGFAVTGGGVEGLYEKARHDAQDADFYAMLNQRGELLSVERPAPTPVEVLALALERYPAPIAVVCDRYRQKELRAALVDAGLDVPIVTRAMGLSEATDDTRRFRRAVVNREITHSGENLAMTFSLSQARVRTLVTGAEVLDRHTRRERNDIAAATLLAVAECARYKERAAPAPEGSWEAWGAVVLT